MFGFKFLGKTHIPHNKNTANMTPVKMSPPDEIVLPMVQHIGAPATPIVKVGDTVKVGQKIAEASSYVSSPIYSSVSGKVTKIDAFLRPDGRTVSAVRIASDGLMTKEEVTPPVINNLEDLIAAVRDSGLVGLGGAGFPTAVKLDAAKNGSINTLVINGAECEPYITSDTRTMCDSFGLVKEGLDLLLEYIPEVTRVCIGIEKNKPEAIAKMSEVFADNAKVEVKPLPSLYPQGAEKVLIYNTTGLVVGEGKLPADVGVIVLNVSSLAFIAEYVQTGMPLVERTLTVDGSAVKEPKNITAPIGTKIIDVIEFAGGLSEPAGKVLYGGPMMGVSVCSLDEPITKTTNAITVLNRRDAEDKPASACIHCGRCVAACPMHLNPTAYAKALNIEIKEERVARLEEYKVMICMECGCCSYVCPAGRPLVQNNRLAKGEVRDYKAHLAKLNK